LFLDPQDEVGPSISSPVALCSFVLLVYIAVLVLVVCNIYYIYNMHKPRGNIDIIIIICVHLFKIMMMKSQYCHAVYVYYTQGPPANRAIFKCLKTIKIIGYHDRVTFIRKYIL